MQQIERYGVIALVFFLVTIVAVSFWGDSKSPGFWSRLTGRAKQEPPAEHILPPANSTDTALTPPAPLDLDPKRSLVADAPAGATVQSAPLVDAKGGVAAVPLIESVPPPSTPVLAPAATNEYVVQKGDSLALIARRTLGKESRWPEIAALNPGLTPKTLKVGAKLALPGEAAAVQPQPVATKKSEPAQKTAKVERTAAPEKRVAAAGSCKVQKGDTLKAIARRELGDGERWQEIVALNPGVSPSKLSVGQVLRLPAGAPEKPRATEHATEHAALVADAGPVNDKPRIR
jgi:nucleoid-associated protein YgaU